MAPRNPTFRDVDGERVPGTWRHAFIRNGGHHLTDLVIYADGLIDCWGLVTLEEFDEKLRSGWVATELPEGGEASVYGIGSWTFTGVRSYTTREDLLGEVRDEIERLNGRPTSTDRCLAAADSFLADPTEANRALLRTAYLEMPETVRVFALGDMDARDVPLRVLAAGPGGTFHRWDEPVDEDEYADAVAYFAERDHWRGVAERRREADGPREPRSPTVPLDPHFGVFRPQAEAGTTALRNEYPAPVLLDGVTYPTVGHGYWALSTDDPARRDLIRGAGTLRAARELAEESPRRPHWADLRLTVMSRLLRAKFAQHPALAEELLRTGDAPLHYGDLDSPRFWGRGGATGRNWTGRLLELVRSELRAERAGL
ncbi:NADAR family protein [Streptomyces sp. NPDC004111]|uniref:NADAR family protein n=1 Tax=Streptomyces sp. NPDC004111 TaxID=3364690 RepID=UPI0036A24E1E